MNQRDQLEELLVDWVWERRQGNELTAAEICTDHPELIPELCQLIEDFKVTDWLEDDLEDSDEDFLHLPDFSTVSREADETGIPECSVTVEEFCQRLVNSGLMGQEQVEPLKERFQADNAYTFAQRLVGDKKLTTFQATVLLEDRDIPLVLDRYVLLGEIGAGGMGAVYKALHQQMDRVVALKILPKEAVDSLEKVKRFHREVKVAAKLEHPNIVTTHDATEDKGYHFLVMSLVKGSDLAKVVRQQGPLSAAKAVNYITQAARGLEHAHQLGIIHRDIKPGNLLLDKKGTVKILDMGLARIEALQADDDHTVSMELTDTGAVMGTVAYLPPEQAMDTRTADARSDVYSLGCTLYYLLTGKAIYYADTMMKTIMAHREQEIPSLCEQREGITPELNAVFQKMVAKAPGERYQSMTELISALDALEMSDTEMTRPLVPESPGNMDTATFLNTKQSVAAPQATRSWEPSKRRWGWIAVCLLGLVGVAWATSNFLKVDTPTGTIVLNIDQPELAGAVVSVDDEKKITLKTGEGQEPIEITADEKKHTLKVVKGGFEAFTKEFTLKAGGQQTIEVRLEPLTQEMTTNPVTASTGDMRPSTPKEPTPLRPTKRLLAGIVPSANCGLTFVAKPMPTPVALNQLALPALPHSSEREMVSVRSCIRCHAAKSSASQTAAGFGVGTGAGPQDDHWVLLNEAVTWANNDLHHGAYVALLTERAQRIGKNLKIVDAEGQSVVHRDLRCLACHSGIPLQELEFEKDQAHLISETLVKDDRLSRGVDCEGCHGAAGAGTTNGECWEADHVSKNSWRFLSAKTKQEKFGFYDLTSPRSKAELCLSCHQGNVRAGRLITPEMYEAGHPPLPHVEIEMFLTQMPKHWRDLDEKAIGIRNEWLEKTNQMFDPKNHLRTQRLLLSALVTLRTQLDLIADLCDSDIQTPLSRPRWIEFAPYALPDGQYQELKPCFDERNISRAVASKWSLDMARLACQFTESHTNQFDDRLNEIARRMEKALEGNLDELIESCRLTSKWLDAAIDELAQKPFYEKEVDQLLTAICHVGSSQELDYDTARQFVWAFHVAYSEKLRKRDPTAWVDEDAFYKTRKLEELSGWIESGSGRMPIEIEIALSLMTEILFLDLRQGTLLNIESDGQQRPFLPTDHQRDENLRANYNPVKLQDRFERLRRYLNKKATSK